jgi:hypothetical protein
MEKLLNLYFIASKKAVRIDGFMGRAIGNYRVFKI